MKMPDSRASVDARVLLDPAGQSMMGFHPNLMIKYSRRTNIEVTFTHVVPWAGHLGRVQWEREKRHEWRVR